MGLFLNSQFCLVGYMSLLRSVACCFDCCILPRSDEIGHLQADRAGDGLLYSCSKFCIGEVVCLSALFYFKSVFGASYNTIEFED